MFNVFFLYQRSIYYPEFFEIHNAFAPEVNKNMPRKKVNVQESLNKLEQKVNESSQNIDLNYLQEKLKIPTRNHVNESKKRTIKERKKNDLGLQIVNPSQIKTPKRAYSKYYIYVNKSFESNMIELLYHFHYIRRTMLTLLQEGALRVIH